MQYLRSYFFSRNALIALAIVLVAACAALVIVSDELRADENQSGLVTILEGPRGTPAKGIAVGACSSSSQVSCTLNVNPTSITQGDSSTLSWSVSYPSTWQFDRIEINNGVGTKTSASGSVNVSPSSSTTYNATAYVLGNTGDAWDIFWVTASCSVSLSVSAPPPPPPPPPPPAGGTVNVVDDGRANGLRVPISGGAGAPGGTTDYTFTLSSDQTVNVTAPATHNGWTFNRWYGCTTSSNRTCTLSVSGGNSYTLTVDYIPPPDLIISSIGHNSGVQPYVIGGSATFKAIVTNQGSSSSGSGFSNRFRYRWSTSDPWQLLNVATMGRSLSGGGDADGVGSSAVSFTQSGTLYIEACADQNASGVGSVNEGSNEGNNCRTQSFSVAGAPDLLGFLITPASSGLSYTLGQSVPLRGNTYNDGTATASAGSVGYRVQIDTPESPDVPGFEWETFVSGSYSSFNLAAGDSLVTPNLSYTPPIAGTYAVRFCTDFPTSNVAEFNTAGNAENNNCSAPRTFTVTDGGGPPDDGGLPQCNDDADNDGDGVEDEDDPGCHTDGNPGNPGSYNPNDDDETDPIGGFAAPDADISAVPDRVRRGENSTISWTANNVWGCDITGTDGYSNSMTVNPPGTVGDINGSVVRQINQQTTFTIECVGPGGSGNDEDSVTVRLLPTVIET